MTAQRIVLAIVLAALLPALALTLFAALVMGRLRRRPVEVEMPPVSVRDLP